MTASAVASSLKITRVSSSIVRKEIATGILPELEYGLLKKFGDRLRFSTADKGIILDMAVDLLKAEQGSVQLTVQVRSFCHSRDVTSDYLKHAERFNMKPCILVLGDVGRSLAPWAQLVQAAVRFYSNEYNIVTLEIPMLANDPGRWVRFGPSVLQAVLRYLEIRNVSCFTTGIGSAVALEALAQSRQLFGRTHIFYNFDGPSQGFRVPVDKLEEELRETQLQLWFLYNDEADVYDRTMEGAPQQLYDCIFKIQTRLNGERKRGRRFCHYDEVIMTEKLNNPKKMHVERVTFGRHTLFAFSDEFLTSAVQFLGHAPVARQENLESNFGIIGDFRTLGLNEEVATLVDGELAALRMSRIGLDDQVRKDTAAQNRALLDRMEKAAAQTLMSSAGVAQAALPNGRSASILKPSSKALTQGGGAQSTGALPALQSGVLAIEDTEAVFWERRKPRARVVDVQAPAIEDLVAQQRGGHESKYQDMWQDLRHSIFPGLVDRPQVTDVKERKSHYKRRPSHRRSDVIARSVPPSA
mmetsp:Transcript_57479/g.136707  ORF Transcript_57479/g.136707 Transcript_57479/m.136707 type:complete len:527 (-) Transcript_57479:76-1656(-)